MTSSWWQRHVEHEFVEMVGNWTMAPTLRARGSGEEPGERRAVPNGHRKLAGDHGQRRPAASRTEARMQSAGEGEEMSRRTRGLTLDT